MELQTCEAEHHLLQEEGTTSPERRVNKDRTDGEDPSPSGTNSKAKMDAENPTQTEPTNDRMDDENHSAVPSKDEGNETTLGKEKLDKGSQGELEVCKNILDICYTNIRKLTSYFYRQVDLTEAGRPCN